MRPDRDTEPPRDHSPERPAQAPTAGALERGAHAKAAEARADAAPGSFGGAAAPPPILAALLGRHSLGPKHVTDPGPDDAALALMLQAARRAPDHAGLVPWRVALVRGASRERLAALFVQAALDAGKNAEAAALDAERARRAPLTVAWIARIDLGHPLVPAHEQWVALGGALTNFLNAAHLLGYAGKMLSGHKARAPRVTEAFCGPGETLVGWVTLGTPVRAPRARPAPAPPTADRATPMADW